MQTRNKNARNCSRSAKNLQTRNTHPFSVADHDHTPLPRGRTESPTTLPRRFSGQGLISCPTPCPHFGLPGTFNGQGPHPEIRPCPSEGVLFTLYLFLSISNRILLIDLQQKQPKMLQVTVFYRGPGAKNGKNAAGHGVLPGT